MVLGAIHKVCQARRGREGSEKMTLLTIKNIQCTNVLFTSGKLKAMFSTLLDCGQSLQNYINKMADEDKVVEVREVAARFTTDIIASIAFGIDVNTIDNPDTDFRRYGRKVI